MLQNSLVNIPKGYADYDSLTKFSDSKELIKLGEKEMKKRLNYTKEILAHMIHNPSSNQNGKYLYLIKI